MQDGRAWTTESKDLQALHWKVWLRRFATAIMPQSLHTCTRYASLTSNSRSCTNTVQAQQALCFDAGTQAAPAEPACVGLH